MSKAQVAARGRFLALEGGEGAGKSTHARLLARALRERGLDVVVTREPGGTPGGERIRELLLDPQGEGWNPRAEALLFAAARSDHVERLIAPALAAGKWVICDRFVDSGRAYQGGGGELADADLLSLHDFGSGGLLADRTILIEVSPAVARARLAARDGDRIDRIGGREEAYHARVDDAFRTLAMAEPSRFVRVDGEGSRESTQAAILAGIADLLPRGAS